jgi:hypothetical protein
MNSSSWLKTNFVKNPLPSLGNLAEGLAATVFIRSMKRGGPIEPVDYINKISVSVAAPINGSMTMS